MIITDNGSDSIKRLPGVAISNEQGANFCVHPDGTSTFIFDDNHNTCVVVDLKSGTHKNIITNLSKYIKTDGIWLDFFAVTRASKLFILALRSKGEEKDRFLLSLQCNEENIVVVDEQVTGQNRADYCHIASKIYSEKDGQLYLVSYDQLKHKTFYSATKIDVHDNGKVTQTGLALNTYIGDGYWLPFVCFGAIYWLRFGFTDSMGKGKWLYNELLEISLTGNKKTIHLSVSKNDDVDVNLHYNMIWSSTTVIDKYACLFFTKGKDNDAFLLVMDIVEKRWRKILLDECGHSVYKTNSILRTAIATQSTKDFLIFHELCKYYFCLNTAHIYMINIATFTKTGVAQQKPDACDGGEYDARSNGRVRKLEKHKTRNEETIQAEIYRKYASQRPDSKDKEPKARIIMLYQYEGNNVSVEKDEVLVLVTKYSADWWLILKNDGTQGYVPANYVKEFHDESNAANEKVGDSCQPDKELIVKAKRSSSPKRRQVLPSNEPEWIKMSRQKQERNRIAFKSEENNEILPAQQQQSNDQLEHPIRNVEVEQEPHHETIKKFERAIDEDSAYGSQERKAFASDGKPQLNIFQQVVDRIQTDQENEFVLRQNAEQEFQQIQQKSENIRRRSEWTPTNYKTLDELGRGTYGIVLMCFDKDSHKYFVAKKTLSQDKETIKTAKNEIDQLKNLDHAHIIDYYGYKMEGDTIIIFMEHMAAGSLKQMIYKFGPINEHVSVKYIAQILDALAYIHNIGIIHSDLKCANLLHDGQGTVKLGDFGIAIKKKIDSQDISFFSNGIIKGGGTCKWMAPEVIIGEGCSRKSDIWSLGCTIVEMLTGEPPHAKMAGTKYCGAMYNWAQGQAINNQISFDPEDLVSNCSEEMKKFLTSLFETDIKKRLRSGVETLEMFKNIFESFM